MTRRWKLVTAEEAKQHPLYGVGGWLALFAFGVLAGFLQNFGAISGEALKIGMTVDKFLSFAVPGVLFIKAALAVGLLKVIVIYALLFSKNSKFRTATTYVLVGELPALLLAGISIGGSPGLGGFLIFSLPSWLLGCAVWVTYIQRSKRVRVTFEHMVEVPQEKAVTGIRNDTPHLEANDVLVEASAIDATYEKIDQELKTDNLDRATWTRAQGDAEGNAERAKALYIRYRAQRLLAASRDKKTRLSTIQGSSPAEPQKKGTSKSAPAFIVASVVAVALIGFVIKQSIAPSFIQLPEKPDLSQGNRLATPEEESKLVPWPVDLSKGAMDWSKVAPEKARDESDLQAEQRTRRTEEVISIRYPNWRDITGSKNGNPTAYRKWLATQPADYQATINSTWNANDIIESIDKFKTDTK